MHATNDAGVQVVYDAVGKATFDQSLKCLAPRGYMVLYGMASGAVPPVDTGVLGDGSLFLTRTRLGNHSATREELERRAGDVLGWVSSGELKLRVEHVFPLSEAAEATPAVGGAGYHRQGVANTLRLLTNVVNFTYN